MLRLAIDTSRLMPKPMATKSTEIARQTVAAILAVAASFDVHTIDGTTTTIRPRVKYPRTGMRRGDIRALRNPLSTPRAACLTSFILNASSTNGMAKVRLMLTAGIGEFSNLGIDRKCRDGKKRPLTHVFQDITEFQFAFLVDWEDVDIDGKKCSHE